MPEPENNRRDDTERIYRERVDCVPDWIWDVDTEGTYTFSNAVVESLLGYTASEVIGRKLFDFMTPEDAAKCHAVFAEGIRTRQPIRNVVHRCFARDGNPKTLESSCVPITENGTVVGFRGISRDIIDELIFQRAAREALANYRAALESAPTAITIIQGDRVVYRNPRLCEISGYTPEELEKAGPFDLVHPDDRERAWDAYERAMRGEACAAEQQYRAVAKSGEVRWLEVRATVITYNGAPAFLANSIDITERKLVQDAIRASEARLTRQQAAIIELAKNPVLASSDLDAALREITETAARVTDVERVSVWSYTEDRTKIISLDLYELSENRHSAGLELLVACCPKYFSTVEESRVAARDAVTAETTKEFAGIYLRPSGITSMMDAAVRLRGEAVGIVCFEHTGPARHWTTDEVNFAAAIANLAALAFEASSRAKAEEALRGSEARYRLLFERSPDVVTMIKNGRFEAVNPAVRGIFGYEPSEIIGLAPWELSPEFQPDGTSSKDKMTQQDARALDSGPHTFLWVGKHKDGSLVDCEISVAAYSAGGEMYVQSILRDVTERKRAEEERLALEKRLEEQKRSFYHETILSVTDGKLDICEECDLEPYEANALIRTDLRDTSDVPAARHKVEDYCRENGLAGDELDLFIAGAGEAITNAIKHGVEGRAYAGRTDAEIWVAVTDRGTGIQSLILPRAVLARGFSTKPSLGLGYSIILDVADRILLSTGDTGTTVVLIKRLSETPPEISVEQLPDSWANIPD